MDSIISYFEGEKLQCIIGVVIALSLIIVSLYFLSMEKTLLKGVAYSFLPLSVFLFLICTAVIFRTPNDIERITTFYQVAPVKMQTEELPRMEKVMKSFSIIKKVEMGLFLVGVVLAIVFWRNQLLLGIGLGLTIQGLILYLFDHFAELRGSAYLEFLKSLQ